MFFRKAFSVACQNVKANTCTVVAYGTAGGTISAVAVGGAATGIFNLVNAPAGSIYSGLIEEGCVKYGCEYEEPTLITRASPFCAFYEGTTDPMCKFTDLSGNDHDMCKEGDIRDAADVIFNPLLAINDANTVKFMYTWAVPLSFGAGFIVGSAIGLCVTTARNARAVANRLASAVLPTAAPMVTVVTDAASSPGVGGMFGASASRSAQSAALSQPLLSEHRLSQ